MFTRAFFTTLMVALLAVGCASNKPKNSQDGPNDGANGANNGLSLELNGDSDSNKAGGLQTVFFAFDSSALDASATDFTPYTDTITLTSSDGSHADFNSTNLVESAGGSSPAGYLNAAGAAYDHATSTVWIQGNDVGSNLYRITGISGTTWTTTKYTGVAATYGENGVNGNYHRFNIATLRSVS